MMSYLFIVGAPKCATTTVAASLDHHPEICVSKFKESRFFTDFSEKTWAGPGSASFQSTLARDPEGYEALFAAKPDATLRVDASTDYLSCPKSAGMIRAFADSVAPAKVKILVILRDPVDRVISEYKHTLRDGFQTATLRETLDLEDSRRGQGWTPLFQHLGRSRYSSQLDRYLELFPNDTLVVDFHDLDAEIPKLWALYGLEPVESAAAPRENISYTPRSALAARLMHNTAIISAARAIVPKRFRKNIRNRVSDTNRAETIIDPADAAYLRELLNDEITACQAHPRIPTENWSSAQAD